MDNYIKKHVDELYATGKTTFRDIDGEYKDYVVELKPLVQGFISANIELLSAFMMTKQDAVVNPSVFKEYAESEIKQLCIDYYGDE